MERLEEINLIKEIIGLSEQKSAFLDQSIAHSPISRYASPERFARERSAIFLRKPVIVARSSEIEGPRAFLTREILGLPVLLARDDENEVRAFLNVCRHRGAKLERETEGCRRIFTCPYHGWSWTNTGELRGVPHERQGFPDLPRAERGLRSLPVVEAHGFIWIIADPESSATINMDEWLGALSNDFEWLDLANHRIEIEETFEVAANWKLLVEGGIEAYHFRVAHKDTIAPHFPDNLSTYKMFGHHMRSVLPRTSMTDLGEVPEEKWSIRRDANVLYTLMPISQFLVQQDHIVWINSEPLSEGSTKIRLATLVPTDSPDTEEMKTHWAKNHKITRVTLDEDFDLGVEIQAGFASRGNPSHLFGKFESALNRFNLLVEEMIEG